MTASTAGRAAITFLGLGLGLALALPLLAQPGPPAAREPPPLPPGLGRAGDPPLPPGLGRAGDPPLPPGLGRAGDPPLPPGLGNSGAPPLPPGLGRPGNPPLPPGLGEKGPDVAAGARPKRSLSDRLPEGLGGFVETRLGPRIGTDPAHSKDYTLAEFRLQARYDRAWRVMALDVKGDLVLDGVTEEADIDLRELRLAFRPGGAVDLRVGRQIMTWGTGDLLFINDLFPKDWQAFLSGRDVEYLKAPSDSVRVGWFAGKVNLDVVYTPRFEPDRYITGERLSFWDPFQGGFRGDRPPLAAVEPDDLFGDGEIALRLYGSAGSFELAGYGYRGFWKSPAGVDPAAMAVTFPELGVYGASVRGPLGPGIGNVEIGYYDSRDDPDGTDPFVNNSELRLLVGYELELARELTGGFQYYLERRLDHDAYRDNLPAGEPRDENRHLLTLRLTKLLRQQTMIASLFAFYSPSDRDGYLRPELSWEVGDPLRFEIGANLFFGRDDFTFFGQFRHNSNLYGAVRFRF